MKLVVIESPFDAATFDAIQDNINYAKRCVWDCIRKGEAPFASHLLYTQSALLDDKIPDERNLGIEMGLQWGQNAHVVAVYIDRGISNGMQIGIDHYRHRGIPIEYRSLLSNRPVEPVEESDGKVSI